MSTLDELVNDARWRAELLQEQFATTEVDRLGWWSNASQHARVATLSDGSVAVQIVPRLEVIFAKRNYLWNKLVFLSLADAHRFLAENKYTYNQKENNT